MEYWEVEGFSLDADAEREKALRADYKTVTHNGVEYRGIAVTEDQENVTRLERLIGHKFKSSTVFYRRYMAGEKNETYIHSDVLIGTFTAILYLNTPEQCDGGTAFWRHKETGWVSHPTEMEIKRAKRGNSTALWNRIYQDGFDESKWDFLSVCKMRWNRLLIFWSPLYHSRYPMEPFGDELSDARLIKTFFLQV